MYDSNIMDASSSILTVFGVGMIIFLFIAIAFAITVSIIQLIGQWKCFKKAGYGGWEVLIPFYNLYVQYKISGVSPWFLIISFIYPIIYILQNIISKVSEYSSSTVLALLSIILALVYFVCSTCFYILGIYSSHKFAKAYGQNIGYTLGLIFFPYVFYPIMGFSKNITYVGVDGKNSNEVNVVVNNSENSNENSNI